MLYSEESGQLLFSFFPWKQLRAEVEAGSFNYVVFQRTKKLPTELFVWGLKYTLDGKESLFRKKISFMNIASLSSEEKWDCQLISDSFLAIYGCR